MSAQSASPHIKKKATLTILGTTLLIVCMFFSWGVGMSLVNSLNTSMSHYLELTDVDVALMQVAYYGAYVVVAVPTFLLTRRFGYQGGILISLALFVLGCVIAIPATNIAGANSWAGFIVFLIALFVMSSGAAMLEANCDPYITKLGDEKTEARRMNIANSFCGLGNMFGPLILSLFVTQASGASHTTSDVHADLQQFMADKLNFLGSVQFIYIGLGIFLLAFFVVFALVRLPQLPHDDEEEDKNVDQRLHVVFAKMLKHPYFALGLLSLFFNEGIQLSGSTMVGWYGCEVMHYDIGMATFLVSVGAFVLTIGRFVSIPVIIKNPAHKVLGVYNLMSAILFFLAFLFPYIGLPMVGLICYFAVFFFNSIGFATIVALALKEFRGIYTKAGACLLITSYLGSAVFTVLFSFIGQAIGYANVMLGFVPLALFITWYGFKGSQIGLKRAEAKSS